MVENNINCSVNCNRTIEYEIIIINYITYSLKTIFRIRGLATPSAVDFVKGATWVLVTLWSEVFEVFYEVNDMLLY